MKTVIVTGSVGAGKTALSKRLAKAVSYKYIDVNKIIKKYSLSEGYDKERKTKLIRANNLGRALVKEIRGIRKDGNSKGIIIDSHLSHYLPAKYADACIAAKCSISVLSKRLKKRGYGKSKIRENLDAEIFNVCLEEAKEMGHRIIIIDTTKGINNKAVLRIVKWLGQKAG